MRHASSKSRGDGVKSVEWSRGPGVQIDGNYYYTSKTRKERKKKSKEKGRIAELTPLGGPKR